MRLHRLIWLLAAAAALQAQEGGRVLLVVNKADPLSHKVADYYRPRRSVPLGNVCAIDAGTREEISWQEYVERVESPIAGCLQKGGLRDNILYIVLAMNAPLKVEGGGSGAMAAHASVDSELTLLYGKLAGAQVRREGGVRNPLFMQRSVPFRHPRFPIYLVTRLAGYDFDDIRAMIDHSLAARNRGKFVIDLSGPGGTGNDWLRAAAALLPRDRVKLDATANVLYDERDVIGYASWGSNDSNRKRRRLGFQWLPGAIASTFVSTSARTLAQPPDDWTFTTWQDRQHFFGGSPQELSADLIHEGASGATGNAYEPYLGACARPDLLFPAYSQGRNLAESCYLALPLLSWQGVILGDPLCSLGKP